MMHSVLSDDFYARLAGSEMADRMRFHDWSASPLGPPANWPESLRLVLELCLASHFPMAIWWGADLIQFYNDRFLRDAKGWRVMVSVAAAPVPTVSRKDLGAIGVDVNADHLAVSKVDRFGNWIGSRRFELPTYGKSTDQAKALIGDVAVAIVALARAASKPIILEKLDF